jgi:hypothetical protein
MPCHHEAIAAVVPLSAADDDAIGDAQVLQQFGATPSGILHEHDPGDVEFRDRLSIDAAHLVAGQCRLSISHGVGISPAPPGVHVRGYWKSGGDASGSVVAGAS